MQYKLTRYFYIGIIWVLLINLSIQVDDFHEKCSKFNWFDTKLDHHSYSNNQTFKLRYIKNTENWRAGKPIFFYCGNEADIEDFCNEMGFLWESSVEFQAMVVFAEHRYFGDSLPFGPQTFNQMSNLEFLTAEQALLDFAFLLDYIKTNTKGAENSKIIAFGGSYGGMLAYMIRVKYPHLIDGALAASAPLLLSEVNCNAHLNKVTQDFTRFGESCSNAIRKSFVIIENLYATQNGRDQITKSFRLCEKNFRLSEFKDFLRTQYELTAMSDYPYETSMFQLLPAWPVKKMCQQITNNLDLNDDINVLEHVYSGLNVWFNYTGDKKCIDFAPPDNVPSDEYTASMYLWCTSIYFPFCSNGITDMFYKEDFSFEQYSDNCFAEFGIRPSKDWLAVEYGIRNIDASSNIIFTNGDLDPWTASGVLKVNSDSLHTILIKDAAHHLDLWTSNKDDPKSVTDARKDIKRIFYKWLEDANNNSIKIKSLDMKILGLVYFIYQIFF